ncbi:hypothetical protein BSLG_009125 [Batrachochytrium salamandrivorans]|nr:hypothetical protein BSLG_009125 [Batrachochytrium salamandrivorans]
MLPSQPPTVVSLTNPLDALYYGVVEVGIPSLPLHILFDTGSSDLWISSAQCGHMPCNSHVVYDGSNSYTYTQGSVYFFTPYGSGSITGVASSDLLKMGNARIHNQKFLESAEETDSVFTKSSFNGIVGLGYRYRLKSNSTTLMDSLINNGLIRNNIFSFYFAPKEQSGSVLMLGGYDPEHVVSHITWIPVIDNSSYWLVSVDAITFGFLILSIGGQVIFDSGTNLIAGNPELVRMLNARLHPVVADDGSTIVACEGQPSMTFVFNATPFTLLPSDYLLPYNGTHCQSSLVPIDIPTDVWVLGNVFLHKVYSVFDMDNELVGLGLSR